MELSKGNKRDQHRINTYPVPFSIGNYQNDSISSKEDLLALAFKAHHEGEIEQAINYYEYIIDKGLEDYRILSNYGSILKDLGKVKEAEIYLQKSIKSNPNFDYSHHNLGTLLIDIGRLKEAEIYLRKAININPSSTETYNNLGTLLIDLGKPEEAELCLRKAININPNFENAHINLSNILKDNNKLEEAEFSLRKAIEINPNSAEAHSNLGNILKELGKSKEAELSLIKAIKIKPDYASAYSNLGILLKDLGKLDKAEDLFLSSIRIDRNFAKGYYSLSTLECSKNNKIWHHQLFSESILHNKSVKDKVDIYFARANIQHKKKNFKSSSEYLNLANDLKILIKPSKSGPLINKSRLLLEETYKNETIEKENNNYNESIFIVGMPRSGSTLIESIISMNKMIVDLGEINTLEESYIAYNNDNKLSLSELYFENIKYLNHEQIITTNKCLYNYQYAGMIAMKMPKAKIIHCFRNPLDNILSIYRAHFAVGNEYSSSLIDCAKVYTDQDMIMTEYKNRFRSKIYDLNYDLLVANPSQEIKSLISWLGWEWDNSYLMPHLNKRSVSTASSVQVRSPINSKSVGGWRNYKEMLQPAIQIVNKVEKYHDITY